MPIVSGSVLFNTVNTTPTTGAGVSNVPVVLRNTTSGNRLVVLTNGSGAFTFNNVTAGTYTLVEAWGTSGGVATPGNFATATVGVAVTPTDPPLASMPSQPTNANAVQSLSPNTINITVSTSDITNRNFVDGPLALGSVAVLDTTIIGANIVTDAGNGTWGTNPAGTSVSTSPFDPYPGIATGYLYTQIQTTPTVILPQEGNYSILNMLDINSVWWNMADHTSRDESGRYQLVNGALGGTLFFYGTVNVSPNTYYYLSFWRANMYNTTGGDLPRIQVVILGAGSSDVYSRSITFEDSIGVPAWNQFCAIMNSGSNSSLIVELANVGFTSTTGNDYGIDDIVIRAATVSTIMSTSQIVDIRYADVGDDINYTAVITNNGQSTATNIVFDSTIPNGTTFNIGSVKVNGTTFGGFNPTPPGFTLTTPSSIPSNQVATITFSVKVTTIPSINPIINSSRVSYSFLPTQYGSTINQTILTNNVSTTVSVATISASNSSSSNFVDMGSIITYTIPMYNYGTTLANNVVLRNTIPNGVSFVDNSVVINGVTQNGLNPSPPNGVSVGTITNGTVTTLSFRVVVTSIPSPNPISSSAYITYNYTSNPTIPIIKSRTFNTNIVTSQFTLVTLSGSVLFNTINSAPTTGTGIPNVPVVLRNVTSGNRLVVLTDANGAFVFNNVTAGSYTLVEAWGTTGGVTTPGNFATAVVGPAVTPQDPPLASMPSQPANANAVQTLNQNTFNITVSTIDATGNNFVDGALALKVLTVSDTTLTGTNLITAANNGTWGSNPPGTTPGTSPATAPYAGVVPNFTYTQTATHPTIILPGDGFYSVLNMLDINSGWWNMADHTSRDETGRYQLVNGATPGNLFFSQTVNVNPNELYYLSLWMSNMFNTTGANLPQATVQVVDGNSNIMFQQALPSTDSIGVPAWNQVATIIRVGNNNAVTLRLVSTGASGFGNDYAVDDIVLQAAAVNTIMTSTISADKGYADVGDDINYTVVLRNIGQSTANNIIFDSTIPDGTTFNTSSVVINGFVFGAYNPTPPGFTIQAPQTVGGGQLVTINYSVKVTTIPSPNPVTINSRINYGFLPVAGGASINQTILSNNVSTTISSATIVSTNYTNMNYVTYGSVITYTIPVQNYGTTLANNVVLRNTIPNGLSFVTNSVSINGVIQNGLNPSPPNGINLGTIAKGAITTVAFRLMVTSSPVPNPIPDSAYVTYNYTSNPTIPTIKSQTSNTNIVTSQFNVATLACIKTVDKSFVSIGDNLSYSVALTNNGNSTASNIVFLDTIPSGTSFVSNSLQQDGTLVSGSPNSPGVTLPNTLGIGKVTTVTFQVTINTIPSPNPVPNSATVRFDYTFNPASPNSGSGVANTNVITSKVNNASFSGITKYVDKVFSYMGDIITYTIVAPNSGNTTAIDIVIKDTIPNGTTFVTNSVTVNGAIINGASPLNGITLPNIGPGGVATITFKVRVG